MHAGRGTRRRRRGGIVAGLVVGAVAVGALFAPVATAATPDSWKKYCRNQGGVVQVRTPTFGTNSPPVVKLAGPTAFCRFANKADDTQIIVDLRSLTTKKPSLAALAYLSKVQPKDLTPGANPGSVYCSELGGTDLFGGTNVSGGGWILGSNVNSAVDACTFPDGSIIDSFGILYHSQNIVRGADLTKKFRYQPKTLPPVFG